MNKDLLKQLFLNRLTIDSESQDIRKKGFNQAIFDKDFGWACFDGTDLDMVMDKFELALSDYKETIEK